MTVFSTSYFPGISYLNALSQSKDNVLDIGEHYAKQTFRNRSSILTANGKQDLSIPVIKPNGNKTLTANIIVSGDQNWRRDHWRAIRTAYASAPYFEHYENEIHDLIFQETEKLVDFNKACMDFIDINLSLQLRYTFSEVYIESCETDYRGFQFQNVPESYQQVVFNQTDFIPELSILDALFCLGPMARKLIA